MGMYTELVLKCSIVDRVPENVELVLLHLFEDQPMPKVLPDHPFFQLPRWDFIGRASSFYHHPNALSSYFKGYLFSRSDLKNYDGEIATFLDWLQPCIAQDKGACIGWSWYESDDKPTLLFKA